MQFVVFFIHFMLYTPLSSTFLSLFFENLLPALVGEHDFQKCMNVKSCKKQLLSPSNRTDYTHFGPVYATWNLQNRLENEDFLLMGLRWRLRLPLCVLQHAFWMTFSDFRNASVIIFAGKWTLLSEATSHQYIVYMSP